MQNKKSELDIVGEILEACIVAYPISSFVISLFKQYEERGSLSKKQLQGLYAKASIIEGMVPGKLATLQAIINKMPNRFKSELPKAAPLYEKDVTSGKMIEDILLKYPQHKRVLFLKSKFDNNETLSPAEITDLKRLVQVLK